MAVCRVGMRSLGVCFFFKQKTAYEMRISDWSSDVCSSDLLDFLGDSPLIAHNAGFDFSFINGELGRCGRVTISGERMVDTLAIARQRHPGAKHTLDALCTRFGIDRSHRVLHGALLDAQLLAQVYVELTGDRKSTRLNSSH